MRKVYCCGSQLVIVETTLHTKLHIWTLFLFLCVCIPLVCVTHIVWIECVWRLIFRWMSLNQFAERRTVALYCNELHPNAVTMENGIKFDESTQSNRSKMPLHTVYGVNFSIVLIVVIILTKKTTSLQKWEKKKRIAL